MKDWFERIWKEHPWLTILVTVYLLLSAPFRWTGAEAALLRPIDAPVLHVPLRLSRPDVPGPRVRVGIRVHDRPVESLTLDENGWFGVDTYLPPVLGPELWAEVEAGWRELEEARAREADRPPGSNWLVSWWSNWQELKPWHPPPGPPSVWIDMEVDPTFVPSELVEDSDDSRTLGVGVGELAWRQELPAEGHGFYAWETTPNGTRFRWTRRWASQPVQAPPGLTGLSVSIRATHPDIAERPVDVVVYWGPRKVARETLRDHVWLRISLPEPSPTASGVPVLSFEVDRTWNPQERGVSEDARELGVMVAELHRRETTSS